MIQHQEKAFDLVVAGGGLAGVCAAIAAARYGLKTCLVHERPVLGGVASSEMRVTVHGAGCHHAWARETGIIAELLAAERQANHQEINENGWTNSVFDMVLYDACIREPNLTLCLSTVVTGVVMEQGSEVNLGPHTKHGYYQREACSPSRRIKALRARTLSAEVELILSAPLFADCTGDAFVADRAGCAWRMGSEGKAEHAEPHAPEKPSTDTMGNSILIFARDVGRPAPFTPPDWAVKHTDPAYFYEQGRHPYDPRGGYWWIEIGIPWNTIHDNETIRHELTRHALGIWDWMKNRDPKTIERCRNYALDFLGQVPGKRESRRVFGHHWLTETELHGPGFPDAICHGGWFIDLHTPGGLLAASSEPASAEGYKVDSEYAALSYVGPYGVPLRCLIARDVDNLFLAGRCVSVSRAALGTVRVMGTTALMGQAVGTAAALVITKGITLPALATDAASGGTLIQSLQQQLLRDGVFIPNQKNADSKDLAPSALVSASSSAQVYGLSLDDPAPYSSLAVAWNRKGARSLKTGLAQLIWCDGTLNRVSLFLDNLSECVQHLPLTLVRAETVWDYRKGGSQTLAQTVLTVAPGKQQWVHWNTKLDGIGKGWLRIEIGAAGNLACHLTKGVLPGHSAFEHLSPKRWRAMHAACAFRVEPAQEAFAPNQIQTGVTRPGTSTNVWRSDAGQGLPQWIDLCWDTPQNLSQVELTFPSQLLTEVHAEGPFYVEPQIPRTYILEIDDAQVLRISGNTQHRRIHRLARTMNAKRMRLIVLETNGDPSASVAEIRVYA